MIGYSISVMTEGMNIVTKVWIRKTTLLWRAIVHWEDKVQEKQWNIFLRKLKSTSECFGLTLIKTGKLEVELEVQTQINWWENDLEGIRRRNLMDPLKLSLQKEILEKHFYKLEPPTIRVFFGIVKLL